MKTPKWTPVPEITLQLLLRSSGVTSHTQQKVKGCKMGKIILNVYSTHWNSQYTLTVW